MKKEKIWLSLIIVIIGIIISSTVFATTDIGNFNIINVEQEILGASYREVYRVTRDYTFRKELYVGDELILEITNLNGVKWSVTDSSITDVRGTSKKVTVKAQKAGTSRVYARALDGSGTYIYEITVKNKVVQTVPAPTNVGYTMTFGGYRVWVELGPRTSANKQNVTGQICTINKSATETAGTAFGIYLVPLSGNVPVNPYIYANNIPVNITSGNTNYVNISVDDNLHGWAYNGGNVSNCLEITAKVIGRNATNAAIPIRMTINGVTATIFSVSVKNTTNEVTLVGSNNLKLDVQHGKSQIEVGDSTGLSLGGYTGVWQPDGVTSKIEWYSSNESIVSILHKNTTTFTWNTAVGVAPGTATVRARISVYDAKTGKKLQIKVGTNQYVEYFEKTANITVTKNNTTQQPTTPTVIKTTNLTLDYNKSVLHIKNGMRLIPTKYPSNSTENITWESTNTSVATVDSNGNVIGVGEGTTVISAKSGNCTATCVVNVIKDLIIPTIKINADMILHVGENKQLNKTILPTGIAPLEISWESSDSKVVTIDTNGTVKAISEGLATITATIKGTSIKDECLITVIKNESNQIEPIKYEIKDDDKIIKNISKNTTIQELISNLDTDKKVTIKDKDGNGVTDKTKLICTGDIIIIGEKEYTAIVTGDFSKDGVVTILDLLYCIRQISQGTDMEECCIIAGDVNENGTIDIYDTIKIIKLIIN